MAEVDLFATQLMEEAKWFCEKATEVADQEGVAANLHASLMLDFCALEAHVNAIGEEFFIRKDLSPHKRGLLLEREISLENGEFILKSNLKMARLEDRIEFLHAKFSGKSIDKSAYWWGSLSAAMQIRNQLTHAKSVPTVSIVSVQNGLIAMVGSLEALYKAIYGRSIPPSVRDCNRNSLSKLNRSKRGWLTA